MNWEKNKLKEANKKHTVLKVFSNEKEKKEMLDRKEMGRGWRSR